MPNGISIKSYAVNPQIKAETTSELSTVGEGIVSRLSAVLDHKIAVTGLTGNIVADSDLSNFDKFVPSSIAAVQKGASIRLPSDEIDGLPGWVIPLKHREKLFGTLIIRNDPAPAEDVIPLAKSLAELLLYQMLIMDRLAQENRMLDKFFYDLFENQQPQEKLLRDSMFFNSQFFQIDFSEPRVTTVVVLKDFWNDVLKGQPVLPVDEQKLSAIKDSIRETFEKVLNTKNIITAYMGMDDFAVMLPHRPSNDKDPKKKKGDKEPVHDYIFSPDQMIQIVQGLEDHFSRRVYIGVGQYHPDIAGLVTSYEGAKQSVNLGIRLMSKSRVFYYSDLLLPVILGQADKNLQKQFVENELGNLIRQPDLIETLATHFDSNMNLKKTAYELGIHKNTLYYRLAKIKKVLSVDPQEFSTAVRLKVALYLWQMLKENESDS